MTELPQDMAAKYYTKIMQQTNLFISINHEKHSHTVAEWATSLNNAIVTRNSSWIRKGYVEEVIRFQN
jgi:hypothetical protein